MPRKNHSRRSVQQAKKQGPTTDNSLLRARLACSGKRAYLGAHAAEEAAFIAELQRGATLSYYRCDVCRKWHLTSRNR